MCGLLSSAEQVNVQPLQSFQFTPSCSRVQAEDRGEVSRFPLVPHHSRFEKPLLVFLGQRSPDGRGLFEWAYIVGNPRPELCPLHNSAQNAEFGIQCRGADLLICSPSPVFSDSQGTH